MSYALILGGLVLLISGVRNTQGDLFDLLRKDLTGPNNFLFWSASIGVIGAVGYVPKLKPISDGFLVLVILVLFLHNKGFFAQFQAALNSTTLSSPIKSSGQIFDLSKTLPLL